MCATILATVDPGDEVVVIEPAHENYVPAIAFAGGRPRYLSLRPPGFRIEPDALDAAVGPRTRVIVVNTPTTRAAASSTPTSSVSSSRPPAATTRSS